MSLFVLRCVIFSLATCLTTCWFYGWPHTTYLLLRARAFCWLCADEVDRCRDPLPPDLPYFLPCRAQNTAIQTLFTVATSTEYALSILPGTVYDNVGVQACGAIGIFLFIAGWTTLTVSSAQLPLYTVAFFLFGHGVNYVSLGCLSLSEYTTNHVYMTMSLSLASQQLAAAIPPILWNVVLAFPDTSMRSVLSWYWLWTALPVGLLFVIFLPSQRQIVPLTPSVKTEALSNLIAPKSGSFWQLIQDPGYQVFVVWYASTNMAVNSAVTNMVDVMGEDVASYFGLVSWVPVGPLLGLMNDYVNSIWSLWGVTVLHTFVLTSFLLEERMVHYLAVSVIACSLGYIHALKVYYVNENYAKEHLGKLVGFASFVSGALQLLNIAVAHSQIPIKMEFGFWVIFSAAQFLMLWFLHQDYLESVRETKSVVSIVLGDSKKSYGF
ncbi:MAG: hypothetical protein KVP17_000369 [Porospora cf. gigantea B]|uniref:uncharacterized protein n=1 Tax=Porospora cf. gigantea B TaxID=2853592 RepID=UPI003571B96A|nr:MAG: hypothetical protein KVP17_000369 [Porospora cf. gigantea B]